MPKVYLSEDTYRRLVEVRTGFETPDETVRRILLPQSQSEGEDRAADAGTGDRMNGFELLKTNLGDTLRQRTGDSSIEIRMTSNSALQESRGRTPRHFSVNRSSYGQRARVLGWLSRFVNTHGEMNQPCAKVQLKSDHVDRAGISGTMKAWEQKQGIPGRLLIEFSPDGWNGGLPAWDMFIPVRANDYDAQAFSAVADIMVKVWSAQNAL